MATVTCTSTVGTNFGSNISALARALEELAASVPDNNATGASSVLTIDNGTGFAKVTISSGPYTNTTGVIAG
jgi:hypothetical protein